LTIRRLRSQSAGRAVCFIAAMRAVRDAYTADTLSISKAFVEARMGIASTAGMPHSCVESLIPVAQ
jgi:hypothetical protein